MKNVSSFVIWSHLPFIYLLFKVWYNNVPHPKLVEYKKDQHWVEKSDDYFIFPGGGTQFKDGVDQYIESIQKVML